VIARLRARHRATFVLLALVLPPFAWEALALRPETALEVRASLPGPELEIEFTSSSAESGPRARISLGPDWNEPDVQLYWSESVSLGAPLPPEGSLWLGSLGASREASFALPRRSGSIVFYSLSRREVFHAHGIPGP